MTRIFIDGRNGTTGLRIDERLSGRDFELITLPEHLRKDPSARKQAINEADVVFLCLPDDEAIKAAEMAENENTVIIDTSTAHRISDGWTYGFAEMKGQREKIMTSKRIANPGCHAIGFISLVHPLVKEGIISKDMFLSCFSLTGYSGGGKGMIGQYEDENRDILLDSPRQYGITQKHKHLPEMKKISGLTEEPAFIPVVGDYYAGMQVSVPLSGKDINAGMDDIKKIYREYYHSPIVHFDENADENGFLSANAFSGKDDMQITLLGNEERMILVSRFDNLGKGASGSAVQNMNIILGIDEITGLNL